MSSSARSRRKRHEEPDEHVNHERWLVTYADMLTLLMVLFIVMFAMSQVDQKKYNALKNGLADGFGSTSSFMKGSDSILEGHLEEASDPELQGTQIFEQLTPEGKAIVTEALHQEKRNTQQESYDAAAKEASRLKEAERKLKAALKRRGLEDDVSTTIDERGLVVSLVSRHVVFRPNIAQLSPRGQEVVDTLAPVLKELGNELRIDGHTNQAAGPPKYFPTDWDLSAARALSVLRRLNESSAIPGDRLSLAAFGHERPLMDPQRPRSQEVNKRVDIVVLPNVGQDARELLDQAANPRPQSTPADDLAGASTDQADDQSDTDAGYDADATSAGHEPEGGSE